jgi:3-deoxy-7-phosphoheptulonate synthase
LVIEEVSLQIESGDRRIVGVMVESNLLAGRQELIAGAPLVYGRSITDACIGWGASVALLERLARAAERRFRKCGAMRDGAR